MIHTLTHHDTQENTMLATVRDYFSEVYCAREGWKVFQHYTWNSAIPELILQKQLRNGYQRVFVGMRLHDSAAGMSNAEFEQITSRLQQEAVGHTKRIVVVDDPEAARGLPDDVQVIHLDDLLQHKIRATEPRLVA